MPGRCRARQAPTGTPRSVGLVGVWALPATASVRAVAGGGCQQAPGHGLIALRPAPARADDPIEEDHLQQPGRVAFGQHRQVIRGDPAIPAPQPLVIGRRLAGEKRPDHRCQVLGPFQGQAGEPERLHERRDEQGVLPDAVHLAQQQQTRRIQ
jgi:hypothetical protein